MLYHLFDNLNFISISHSTKNQFLESSYSNIDMTVTFVLIWYLTDEISDILYTGIYEDVIGG